MNGNTHSYASNPYQPRLKVKKPRILSALASLVTIAMLSFISITPASAADTTTVRLKTSGNYSVLAGTTVTKVGTSVVGKIGISPGISVTGLPLINGITNSDTNLAVQAQADLSLAYADAERRPTTATVSAQLAGQRLAAGVYQSDTGIFNLDGTLTLDGQNNPNSVFILEADTLTTDAASQVKLINGAQACNVFFLVKGSATLGSNSLFVGTIIALDSITAEAKAKIEGRLLARNGEVSLNANLFTAPGCNKAEASASLARGSSTPPATNSDVASSGMIAQALREPRVAAAPDVPFRIATAPSAPAPPAPADPETPAALENSGGEDNTGYVSGAETGAQDNAAVLDSEDGALAMTGGEMPAEQYNDSADTQDGLAQTGAKSWIPVATGAGLVLLLIGAVFLFLNRHRLPQR